MVIRSKSGEAMRSLILIVAQHLLQKLQGCRSGGFELDVERGERFWTPSRSDVSGTERT